MARIPFPLDHLYILAILGDIVHPYNTLNLLVEVPLKVAFLLYILLEASHILDTLGLYNLVEGHLLGQVLCSIPKVDPLDNQKVVVALFYTLVELHLENLWVAVVVPLEILSLVVGPYILGVLFIQVLS